jgi:soluble P-type ATPase
MTRPGHVNLGVADDLVECAALMVGDGAREVLAVLMAAVATVILDANEDDPAKAIAAAHLAGPPLAEMVEQVLQARLLDAEPGGTA